MDLRKTFYNELKDSLTKHGITAIIKEANPENGPTIKLSGKVLFKSISLANHYGTRGVVLHPSLSDEVIATLGGSRAKGKKNYVIAPLTTTNYAEMMEVCIQLALNMNMLRSSSMKGVRKRRSRKKREIMEHPTPWIPATTLNPTIVEREKDLEIPLKPEPKEIPSIKAKKRNFYRGEL